MNKKMKASGVDWIGDIPEDWIISKIKYIINDLYTGATPQSENSKFYDDEGIPFVTISDMSSCDFIEKTNKSITELGQKFKNLKVLSKGTILYSIYATIGKVSELNIDACINQALLAISPNKSIDNKYLKYWLKAMETYVLSQCFLNSQNNLNISKVKNFDILISSKYTQNLIVETLDKKCTQIDKLISNQKQQIEKLKQYKQSLITEVVTKGLDSNVPMKDSGIEWIGEIPEDWEVNRIKYICKFNPNNKKTLNSEDKISYAPMECIKNGYMIKKEIKYKNVVSGLTYFEENDILMAKVTPCFENGNITIATNLKNNMGYGSSELFVFRVFDTNIKWFFYFLRNDKFNKLAKSTMTGTGGLKRVSGEFIKNLFLAIPKIEEQEKIVAYLDEKCTQIDDLIKIKEEKIQKLNDYKKSLIYEYVTGKKEVVL